MLIAEGNKQYFGLVISGARLDEGISVGLKDSVVAMGRLGRDARALQAELVNFPGFGCMEDVMESLLGVQAPVAPYHMPPFFPCG
jgi:hypothetical protein